MGGFGENEDASISFGGLEAERSPTTWAARVRFSIGAQGQKPYRMISSDHPG